MASTILNANSTSATSGQVLVHAGGTYPTGSVTIPSSYTISTGGTYSTSAWSSVTSDGSQPSLHVTGSAEIKGDLKVKGISVVETLEAINKRLAILVPDPEKLEHFEALKKAYEHYKLLEALCEVPKEKKE